MVRCVTTDDDLILSIISAVEEEKCCRDEGETKETSVELEFGTKTHWLLMGNKRNV